MSLRALVVTATASVYAVVGNDIITRPKPVSADLRRWEGNTECKGKSTVINNDPLDTCVSFWLPRTASLLTVQTNDTMYSTYHYAGVKDCTGDTKKHETDYTVGTCEPSIEGTDSLMRVWVYPDYACNNTADLQIYDGIKHGMPKVQKDCIMQGAPGAGFTQRCLLQFIVGKGEACMSDCVSKRTHLSATCSACFGAMSTCGYKNCVSHCLDSTSPSCISCTKQHCLSDFTKCSGFADLPPVGLASYKGFLV